MDETYLTLRGWIAYRLKLEEVHYFVHNRSIGIAINRREILEGEYDVLRPGNELSIVKYSEVPSFIMKRVYNFEANRTT
jgi:hypothetical protein